MSSVLTEIDAMCASQVAIRSVKTARPRILMVTPQYFPHMGGVQTHIYHVTPELLRAGYRITVLTTDTTGELAPAEELNGVQIERVSAWPRDSDYYLAPAIYQTITKGEWDVVHCQGIHTLVPPVAMLAALRAGVPYMVTFHTGGHSRHWRNYIRSLQWRILRPLLKRATSLIAVSQFEAEIFRNVLRLPYDQIPVIPNGAEVPKLAHYVQPDPDAPTILSVGRLEKYKGHHRAIAALPKVREQIPNARLRIAGSGPYELELKRLARELDVSDHVHIGSVPVADRSGMAELVARASVVTLISDYEAHPISVMEALALGKPVVVANTSGLGELAERGYATSVPLDVSPEKLAEALIEKIVNPQPPHDFELPTWEECAASLSAVYQRVTRGAA